MKKLKIKFLPVLIISIIFVLFSIGLFVFTVRQDVLNKPEVSEAYKLDLARNIASFCKNNFNWRDCYGKKIAQINYRLKLTDSLNILGEIEKLDNRTRDCHLIAHRIATSEVEKNPRKWVSIFDYVDQTTCNNGFVHGVIEGRSKFDSTLVLDERTIPEICSQIEERTSRRLGKTLNNADDACSHIIGHILLAQEMGVVRSAVNVCNKIPDDIRSGCFDGVFMENITRENLEAHEVAQKLSLTRSASLELEAQCKFYTGEAAMSCWRELAHIYTVIGENNPEQVYKLCYQAGNLQYANECFMHSINLMILSDKYSNEDLGRTCQNYLDDETRADSCITRSLFPLLGSSVEFIDRAVIFCEAQPVQYKRFCYTRIGAELESKTTPVKRIDLCQKVPKDYLDFCLKR